MGMMTTDDAGTVWQSERTSRSYTEGGKDFAEDGQPALWEDSDHPTWAGAEVHFRCLVKAFRSRCASGGFICGGNTNTSGSNQSWNTQQGSWQQGSWHDNRYARSHPYAG